MFRSIRLFVSSAIAALSVTTFLAAQTSRLVSDQPAGDTQGFENESTDLWFVELSSAPTAEGTSLAIVHGEKASFRRAAAAGGVNYQERRSFDVLFNGLSVRASASELAKLRRIDGVKAVYPVSIVTAPEPEPQPGSGLDLTTALAMTGADVVQNTLGFTGAGVKVGVIDSGIDYNHPDLGGCFGPGCRVATGYDFVGDKFNPASVSPDDQSPKPDPDPDDCNGHGTHVAGIVGANGAIKGVAPGVTFGAYRVFGCDGPTTTDIMLAAMERALADGMQVVNMSIGSSRQWPEYPTAQASTRLVNKGVVVVASAGNDASIGLYGSSAPAVGSKVISVAAMDNTHNRLPYFTVTSDAKHIGYNAAVGAPAPPRSGTASMARTGTPTSTADGCAQLPADSLAGKVALIRRGGCTFNMKAFNAQNAGAIGVVLYNNVRGRVTPTVAGPAGTPAITIPVVAVSDAEGVLINNRVASEPVVMTWTDQLDSFLSPTGGLISSFSSYGVSPDLVLKPDISAPGGSIFSTYPLELGGYANLSGTSMSSPHVAGAVALLLQAKPHTSPQAVRGILQNSADPHLWFGDPSLGLLDDVHRQGAGIVRIDRAILATATVTPGKLSLGESEFGPVTQTLTISNKGADAVTYDLSHAPALATGPNTFMPAFFDAAATVIFSAPNVTVPAGGKATVNVTIGPDAALADHSLYGGYIVLTPQGGGQALRVPFAGFKGDYQSIQVLTSTTFGFPWLAKLSGAQFVKQPDGAKYTLVDIDIPFILVHLDHQSQRLRIDVVDANTGRAWHRALDEQFLPRNASANGFFSIPWDGLTTVGNGKKVFTVPNGQYRLVLTILKALGDEDNPAHLETWTSPVITIARP